MFFVYSKIFEKSIKIIKIVELDNMLCTSVSYLGNRNITITLRIMFLQIMFDKL